MKNIGKVIAAARAKKGMTQSDLARALGVKPQAVQKWEAGGGPKRDRIEAIASVLGISQSELLEATQAQLNEAFGPPIQTPLRPVRSIDNQDEIEHEILTLPRYSVRPSMGAGEPIMEIEERGEPNYMRRSWARRRNLDPTRLFTVVATGNSMEPEIRDGSSVTIYKQQNIMDDKMMMLCYRDQCYIKRVLIQGNGSLILRSENRDKYRDIEIDQEEIHELHIVGVVVNVSHDVW